MGFALEHPGLFKLMFMSRGATCPPEFAAAANRAYEILAVRAASLAGKMSAEDLPVASWALVHGLAALSIDGRLPACAALTPTYLMWLEWEDGRISFIHDYRYARHIVEGAELVIADTPQKQGR